ncbi:MAG TPA: Ig-like domain-containing protein [Acidimicrobiales bacterium]|nr:Ig-like domain-containing protein [Acidimicrobiales bacterium]
MPTFTWTGADAASQSVPGLWSDGGNWSGGVAPQAPGPFNLSFPACSGLCENTQNDIAGLTVGTLSVLSGDFYQITGDPFTLDNVVASGPFAVGPQFQLGTSSTWSISGANTVVYLDDNQPVTGPGSIDITLSDGALLNTAGFSVAGSITVNGADPSITPSSNGLIVQRGNGTSPWSVSNVEYYEWNTGANSSSAPASGSLTLHHADLEMFPNAAAPGATATTFGNVAGNVTADSSSTLGFNQGGNGSILPALTASGTITLGSANLVIYAGCPHDNSSYLVIQAAEGISGTFTTTTPDGQFPAPDGAIVESPPFVLCGGAQSDFLQLHYSATAVIATAVITPAIVVTSSSPTAIPGESVTYTSHTLQGLAGGTVAFTDGGTSIAGCAAVPLVTGTGQATCTTSYAATGTHQVTATYSNSYPPTHLTSPPVTVTIVPPPPPIATITTGQGVFARPEVINGTASDVGGPGVGEILFYYKDLVTGVSGVIVATCTSCGAGQTSTTWHVNVPASGLPGVYQFVAQPVDVANNFGGASNQVFQIVV